jgi:hypothetical protein
MGKLVSLRHELLAEILNFGWTLKSSKELKTILAPYFPKRL